MAKAPESGRFSDLFAHSLRPALFVGIGLAIFQQITGINTVIYYAPLIIQTAGISSASGAILATAGIGAVNVLMTIVSMWLIDRAGRRAPLGAIGDRPQSFSWSWTVGRLAPRPEMRRVGADATWDFRPTPPAAHDLMARRPAFPVGPDKSRRRAEEGGHDKRNHRPHIPAVGRRLQRSRPLGPAAIFVPRLLEHGIARPFDRHPGRGRSSGAILPLSLDRARPSRHAAAFSAWSRSARMSSMCSMPIERRT